ncbi:phosphoribosylglycinamide formyltransferase [Enterovirga aerilata]|uniref:Phosphoribosylglycinamide formyltransferase n=1 Tax=Enterovirga aerilata TaxID=2730920 RepID=A0A849IBH4_9HYPH|nr:phosphoribosylglycinamide formyltransferase [Enterovirga sp. DB1703]NNM73327.1 phosphoribosylglycinamide formyltransferase [Enterovirga sp. DB1703]
MAAAKKRVGILISGRGSNMASLIEAAQAPDYPAEIALVVSNRPGAAGLVRAQAAGVATAIVDHRLFPARADFDAALGRAFEEAGIELICLAGFMRILTDGFVQAWLGRMLNIHPSLLPLFKGLHPHRQALEAGVRIHGCTVHFVVPELDSGPIVAQAAVPVLPGDTEEMLASRVLAEEHRLYPLGLSLVAAGQARLEGGRTVFANGSRTALGLA